jgi:hypothetical protein
MQDRIGALINWFGSQFTSSWPKQRQQFTGLASNVLMILAGWHAFRLK